MQNTQWHTARFIDSFDRIMCKVCLGYWELDARNNTKPHPRHQQGWLFGLMRDHHKRQSDEGYKPNFRVKFICSSENINWADKISTGIPFDMPGGDNHDNN